MEENEAEKREEQDPLGVGTTCVVWKVLSEKVPSKQRPIGIREWINNKPFPLQTRDNTNTAGRSQHGPNQILRKVSMEMAESWLCAAFKKRKNTIGVPRSECGCKGPQERLWSPLTKTTAHFPTSETRGQRQLCEQPTFWPGSS